MLVGREPAKMRPSKDLTTCGRVCAVRPGSSSEMAGCPPGLSRIPEGRPAGVQDCSRAPLVTRLGGQAVKGTATEDPTPHSAASPRPGGGADHATTPGTPAHATGG